MFESAIVHTYLQSAIAFATEHAPQPFGSAHPLNAPYQAFQTKDGWINIGASNQSNWLRLLEVLSAQALKHEQYFSSNAKCMKNLPVLIETFNSYLINDTTQNWLKRMEIFKGPSVPVNDILQMQSDLKVLARDMVIELRYKTAGKVKTLGHPVKFSRTPAIVTCSAPTLSQHTQQVFSQIGYSPMKIRDFIKSGDSVGS